MSPTENELAEFRAKYRAWLQAHVPSDWESQVAPGQSAMTQFQARWMRELYSGGWTAPHWPTRYGGLGATVRHQLIMYEENLRANAPIPHIYSMSLIHLAATLIAHGSEDQKNEHLPRILRGEEIWCQGFSEPDAGSDLAALRTRAIRDGDHYVVNGQKVWSSLAYAANWCMLLARTDPKAPKHHGISYFLMPIDTPGVEVRPLRQLTGESDFCEIFLTDVWIPAENLVGAENEGWQVARTTLSAERGLAMLQYSHELRAQLQVFVRGLGHVPPGTLSTSPDYASVWQTLGRYYSEIEILSALCESSLTAQLESDAPNLDSSIIKLTYSELAQRFFGEAAKLAGLGAQLSRSTPSRQVRREGPDWLLHHLRSWALTIAGGTNEIQRNMIGERLLGLPREPLPLESA
jgi:alkylation response protein AidB-like acyl-CoA dehydrogenase